MYLHFLTSALLLSPLAGTAHTKTFVLPHVLEKDGIARDVGIKEEGVKSLGRDISDIQQKVANMRESLEQKKTAGLLAPRDRGTGQSSGKRQHSVIKSPRDAASGQASGKRAATNLNSSRSNRSAKDALKKAKKSRSNAQNNRVQKTK